MSYGGGEAGIELETMRGRDWPGVRQFSIFLQNRVGAMLDLVRRIESSGNRIVALTVLDSTDCAIVRLIPSHPERAYETLQQAKLPFHESDLVLVELPSSPSPIGMVCKALLSAELSIHYAYPMLLEGTHRPVLAIYVDSHEMACQTLQKQGFTLLSEADLQGEG